MISAALLCLVSLCSFTPFDDFNPTNTATFIDLQSDIAVREMWRTGIPASVTIAQSIVESSWGTGTLALEGNNYFGIKCKDNWTGATLYQKDDDYHNGRLVASCFRVYPSVDASFVDHSNFLLENPRYATLFQLDPADYKGWARGLKKAGYATDKAYAKKLIANIEKYQLYQYDTLRENINIETGLAYQASSTNPIPVQNNIAPNNEVLTVPATFVLPDDYTPNYFDKSTIKGQEVAPLIPGGGEPMPALSTEAFRAVPPVRQ